MNRSAPSGSAPEVGLWLNAVAGPGDSQWAYMLRYGQNDKRDAGTGQCFPLPHAQLLALRASLSALTRPCRVQIFVEDEEFGNLTLVLFNGRDKPPGIEVPEALWDEVAVVAARHMLTFVKASADSEEPLMGILNQMVRDARVKSETESIESDECVHELPRGWCDLCKALPKGVALRGFRTRGGSSYHNDAKCKFLAEGQSAAAARGQDVHEIESISWYDVSPGVLEPCLGCCRSNQR